MKISSSPQTWRVGFSLSLITMFLWGVLPLGLKLALQALDVFTLTWIRFVFAAILMSLYLGWQDQFPSWETLKGHTLRDLAIASVFLALNYFLFLQGLSMTTASNAEVLIQLAPALLGLGGIFVFNEHYTRKQWFGFGLLGVGLILFFQDQLQTLLNHLDRYLLGSLIIIAAAIAWTIYALIQKQILKTLSSPQTMLLLYAGCAILFTPFIRIQPLFSLSDWNWLIVLFCGLNTLIAYGAFGEAMMHWEASRISAVLALSPIVTLIGVDLVHHLWPTSFLPEPITPLGWLGAIAVVMGSWLTALGRTKMPQKSPL
jgi:drug/metabolite transporter (DMT)-like permease